MEGGAELFSRRSVLESQEPGALLALRDELLSKEAALHQDIVLVEDVLAAYGHDEENERLANDEELAQLQRVMGSYGLYDASLDRYETKEHPGDDQWAIRSNK